MEKLGPGILTVKNEEGKVIFKERVDSLTFHLKNLEVKRLKGDGEVASASPTDIILTIQVDKINTILVPLRLVKKVEGVYDKN